MRELASIAHYGRFGIARDPVFITGTTGFEAWSSSSWVSSPLYAWRVDFQSGAVILAPKTNVYAVRAVRGGE